MSEENEYRIYDNKFWWSDAWDPLTFGQNYDANRDFSSQFIDLLRAVPHRALARYNKDIVNSEYTVQSFDVKNCYLSSIIGMAQDVSYGFWVIYSQNSLDLSSADHVQDSYEIIDSDRIHNSQHIQNSSDCINSYFLFDCHNCQNCFGCSNLRNKKFCFFNEQLSKEDYEKRMAEIDLGSRKIREEYKKKFDEFLRTNGIFKALWAKNSPGSLGDHLRDCKNCVQSFWGTSAKFLLTFYKNENIRYGQDFIGATDCMDVTIFGPGQECYNVIEALSVNRVIASYFVENCLETEYSFECSDCQYCFGCSGLSKKKYCILNKQYSEDEYWKLVDEIKTSMVQGGGYGEFLPLGNAFFFYEDSYAGALCPLDENRYSTMKPRLKNEKAPEASPAANNIPDNIKNVADSILDSTIICEVSRKPFKITKQEFDFYRKHSIPVPLLHPRTRLLNRFRKRSPYDLFGSHCSNCGKDIKTAYDPELHLRVYCEECYQKEIV